MFNCYTSVDMKHMLLQRNIFQDSNPGHSKKCQSYVFKNLKVGEKKKSHQYIEEKAHLNSNRYIYKLKMAASDKVYSFPYLILFSLMCDTSSSVLLLLKSDLLFKNCQKSVN